jgi:hypothetical protein
MMASGWTDEDSRVAAEKIIKRAEISKVPLSPWQDGVASSEFGSRVSWIRSLFSRILGSDVD